FKILSFIISKLQIFLMNNKRNQIGNNDKSKEHPKHPIVFFIHSSHFLFNFSKVSTSDSSNSNSSLLNHSWMSSKIAFAIFFAEKSSAHAGHLMQAPLQYFILATSSSIFQLLLLLQND